jgi:hypothetical protein
VDGKLVRVTSLEEIARAKERFCEGHFHGGLVLQDLEARA